MHDEIRSESLVAVSIRSFRQELLQVAMSVVVQVDGQAVILKVSAKPLLEVDAKPVYQRKLVGLKSQQQMVLGDDVREGVADCLQQRLPVRAGLVAHADVRLCAPSHKALTKVSRVSER